MLCVWCAFRLLASTLSQYAARMRNTVDCYLVEKVCLQTSSASPGQLRLPSRLPILPNRNWQAGNPTPQAGGETNIGLATDKVRGCEYAQQTREDAAVLDVATKPSADGGV